MYIQRKPIIKTNPQTQVEYVDGYEFVTETGVSYKEIRATVNKRPIVADIVQADTSEGWIDVELPEFETTEMVESNGTITKSSSVVPVFDPKVKRIEGTVKIYGIK